MPELVHGAGAAQETGVPGPLEIRQQLQRLLASDALRASEHRREFLRFVVEETLAGRSDHIKGFSVANAVFDRDETFDPKTDPVVRLEARRLRRDLDSYYAHEGQGDPVRVWIDKGSYVPRFEWFEHGGPATQRSDARAAAAAAAAAVATAKDRERKRFRQRVAAGLLLLLLVVAAVAWNRLGDAPAPGGRLEPRVFVTSFEVIGPSEDGAILAEGVTTSLVDNLTRFPGFRIFSVPGGAESKIYPFGRLPGEQGQNDYHVSGSVQVDHDSVEVAARAVVAASGEVIWSNVYERELSPIAILQLQRELANIIATEIGQPYGIVNTYLNQAWQAPRVRNLPSYICVLRARQYRKGFSRPGYEAALPCLENAVRIDPEYSDAWAMLGWLYLDAGRWEYAGLENLQQRYEMAYEATSRAVELDSRNTLALMALSTVNHYLGHYEESERLARRALQLNPNDPDSLAQLGWRLAARGEWSEGISLLEAAIDRSYDAPGWYYMLIALRHELDGDYESMRAAARNIGMEGLGLGQVLIAIAEAHLGNREAAAAALARFEAFEPAARDLAAFSRRQGFNEEIVERLTSDLEQTYNFVQSPGRARATTQ